jgi:hypothetical protein
MKASLRQCRVTQLSVESVDYKAKLLTYLMIISALKSSPHCSLTWRKKQAGKFQEQLYLKVMQELVKLYKKTGDRLSLEQRNGCVKMVFWLINVRTTTLKQIIKAQSIHDHLQINTTLVEAHSNLNGTIITAHFQIRSLVMLKYCLKTLEELHLRVGWHLLQHFGFI